MRDLLLGVMIIIGLLTAPIAGAQGNPGATPSAAFASLDGYTSAEISPDGKRLAYLYPLNERLNLVIHEFASGKNTVIPPLEGLDFRWLHWANDETVVYSMSLSAVRITGSGRTETEETRLLSTNAVTGKTVPLVKPAEIVGTTGSRTARSYYPEAQVQDDVIDWMPGDPEHILVALDEDFDGRYEVRRVNVDTGSYRIHRNSIEGVQNWIVDASGEIRLGYGYRLGEVRIIFKDAAGNWLTLDEQEWFDGGWTPARFTGDPRVIFVTGYGDDGTYEVRTLDSQTGEFVKTVFSNPTYDVDHIVLHPISGKPIGIAYTEHQRHYEYFDPEFDKLQKSINRAVPGYSNHIRSVSSDLSKIVIHSSNAQEPGMLLIWDRAAKTMEPFGWFNEALDPELLAAVEPVEYESDDGTAIPAYLTLPATGARESLPAIVMPHGGPVARDSQAFWFLGQFLASRGYAVLQPNFRGSAGYGWKHEQAGYSQWGGLMQRDVDAGARWLAESGIADPERMCIVGWSYGGYSATVGVAQSPDLYECAVGINGVYNLPRRIAAAKEYVGGTIWSRHIGLDGESTRGVSPHHLAERIEAPILLIHAEDDHRVRVDQATQFHKRLQSLGKDSRLVVVEHGGHSMVNSQARKRILDETEAFLAEYIGSR